ncbi:MAG TPA: DUF883 family protein [Steroidobacteraceae bacterium]|nr:DUF883 family protein [Steroidobacteraceae bacterium]
MSDVGTRTLIDDLRALVADAEALVAVTAGDLSDRAQSARQSATDSVETARARLADLEADLQKRAMAVKDDATRYVHDNPWQSIGIAAAIGVVVGVLLGRR